MRTVRLRYGFQNKLLEQVREAKATVTNGQVVDLPNLSNQDDTYTVGQVKQSTDLQGRTVHTVQLVNPSCSWLSFELDYHPETGWDPTPYLCDKLNHLDVSPDCSNGKVGLEKYVEATSDYVALTEEELDWLGLEPDSEGFYGCVEAHPEGADRGGYVPTLTAGPYYDEGGCEWQG